MGSMKTLLLWATAFASVSVAQITPVWELNDAQGTTPTWFGSSGEETGVAAGEVDSAGVPLDVVLVASSDDPAIYVLDASTGAEIMTLDMTGVSGGDKDISDVEIADDGVIYASNMVESPNPFDVFKVYRWSGLTATPALAGTYSPAMPGTMPLGDQISIVAGRDKTVIYAPISEADGMIYFTTEDGETFTSNEFQFGEVLGEYPDIVVTGDRTFYASGDGSSVMEFDEIGALVGEVSSGTIPSDGSNALTYFALDGRKFLFAARNAPSDHFATVTDATSGYKSVFALDDTPLMGNNPNADFRGDVDVIPRDDGTADLFVLTTNNGLACYRFDPAAVDFAGAYAINPRDGDFACLYAAFDALSHYGVSGGVLLEIGADLIEDLGSPTLIASSGVNEANPLDVTSDLMRMVTLEDAPDGVVFEGVSHVTVDPSVGGGITLETNNGAAAGVTVRSGCERITLRDVHVTDLDGIDGDAVLVEALTDDVSDVLVENCTFGSEPQPIPDAGVRVLGDAVSGATVVNVDVVDCRMDVGVYGVYVSVCDSPTVSGNVILSQGPEDVVEETAGVRLENVEAAVVNKNLIRAGKTAGAAPAFGVHVDSVIGDTRVFNNMIWVKSEDVGGVPTNDQPGYGIGFSKETPVVDGDLYVEHNTIYMPGGATTGEVAAFGSYNVGAVPDGGLFRIVGNIFVNEHDDTNAYAVEMATQPHLFMRANDLYVSGTDAKVGKYGGAYKETVADWMTASGSQFDVSHPITFVDAANGDLHLDASHEGDDVLASVATSITIDYDGQARLITAPYMGADELSVVVPVLLTSFAAQSDDEGVVLTWETAEETDVAYFEAQRQDGDDFVGVGRIDAKGSGSSYRFVDAAAKAGVLKYRLKVVDRDGSFSFADVIEVAYDKVAEYALDQNYPNPFNPTTTINYELAEQTHVKLVVFNILGEEVATLVNSNQQAGSYKARFNASNLAGGMYVYRLETPAFTKTLKMSLVK